MKVVDINILIYAVNRDAPRHARAKEWWEQALSSEEPVGLTWIVLLGFLRIITSGRIMPNPLLAQDVIGLIEEWLHQPTARLIVPTAEHWAVFKELLEPLGTAGNLTSDAHLAALAIEHGAYLYSTDNDFARFAQLRWANPLE